MPLESTSQAPRLEDFTPLSEHQAQTPTTFFGARPVLHQHSSGITLSIRKADYEQSEELRELQAPTRSSHAPNGVEDEDIELEGLDVWVTSQNVILFSPTSSQGVTIPYPTIALHALGTHNSTTAVYLQLDLHDPNTTNDDADMQTLSLHLVPTSAPTLASNGATTDTTEAKAIFEALSACADLNPDPMDEDEDGEAMVMPQPEPGVGGWITSENMHEFTDSEGNWTGPEIQFLGAGAGQVRAREDHDDGVEARAGEEEDETKWRRTE